MIARSQRQAKASNLAMANLRDEVAKLKKDNNELKRDKDNLVAQVNKATKEKEKFEEKIRKFCDEGICAFKKEREILEQFEERFSVREKSKSLIN